MTKKLLWILVFPLLMLNCYTELKSPPPRQWQGNPSRKNSPPNMPLVPMPAQFDSSQYIRLGQIDNYVYLDFLPLETNPHPNVKPIESDGAAAISPNRELAILLDKDMGRAEIYDKRGNLLESFGVEPLSDVLIANDGRFVVYGNHEWQSKGKSYLKLYAENGMEMGVNETFGQYSIGDFSPSGEIFVFIATLGYDNLVAVKIFDENFYEIGEHIFEDWHYQSELEMPKFDEENGTIIIHRLIPQRGQNVGTRETIILDGGGNILELRAGWY